MSAHVKVYRGILTGNWHWTCREPRCPYRRRMYGLGVPSDDYHPTHAEALAAAWAHIKEHS